jgi:hypothetical protein
MNEGEGKKKETREPHFGFTIYYGTPEMHLLMIIGCFRPFVNNCN